MTAVSLLNPIVDGRWHQFVEQHPRASVFHSPGWLEALQRTYGYRPMALTTTPDGPLASGVAFCDLNSWMSRRLVSLPFSDHCEPLVDRPEDLSDIVTFAARAADGRPRAVELRPRRMAPVGVGEGNRYYLHTLDLARPAAQIFDGFHRSTRGTIRRAEREALHYEVGTSERLLSAFYRLLRLTRRRHGLPPQPLAWFRNLIACLGDAVAIHVASIEGRPIAAILTLTFKRAIVYKYTGSDARYHRLGPVPFLLWRAIEEARAKGIEELDLGRSDVGQRGLVEFKDHFGAVRSTLTYYRWPARSRVGQSTAMSSAAHRIVKHLPDAALDMTGRLLYRHWG